MTIAWSGGEKGRAPLEGGEGRGEGERGGGAPELGV